MNRNYEPCLFEVSDDWQERWALIREFATKWYGVHFRSRESLIPLVKYEEERLGFKLPPSFQEYIMFHTCANQALPGLHKLKYYPKLSTISFEWISDGEAFSAIDIEDLEKDDPLVQNYFFKDEYFLENEEVNINDKELTFTDSITEKSHTLTYVILNKLITDCGYSENNSVRGGSCDIKVSNNIQLVSMMDCFFQNKIIFEDRLLYEKQNMIATLDYLENGNYTYKLSLSLWKPLCEEEIPKFILQLIGNSGHYTGLFRDIFDEISNSRKNIPNKFNLLEDNENEDTGLNPIPF